ncbi:hypothetical protein ACG1BZ_09600 [Microbulbifer sp. CNSA002]|uniref:hypothetical protein n=1 Tax=Microbulbifer sp. CNSA002 TaxID=3373604 RepID=UPI0039B5A29D
MVIRIRKILPFILLPLAFAEKVASAEDYQDPFETNSELFDEVSTEGGVSRVVWDIDASLLGYHQQNEVRDDPYFDPGLFVFDEQESLLALDLSGQFSLGAHFSVYSRFAAIEHYRSNEAGTSEKETESHLLEGYFSSYTDNRRFGINVGRIKPQWSNGYNWSPANLLKATFDRPNLDADELTQQLGWDMAHFDFRYGRWNTGIYMAQVEDDLDGHFGTSVNDHEFQYALVVNREGDLDTRLVLHQMEGETTNVALGLSTLAGDSATLRLEGAWEHQRELPQPGELSYFPAEDDGYLKLVLGTQLSFNQGWDVTAEYLYNQHGFDDDEWGLVQTQVDSAKNGLNSARVYEAISFLSESFNLLSSGQLRQEYLFLMWGNTRLDKKFQYRQSVQYNLDDKSQYHNLELIQNWTEHFSTRLQAQFFRGCESCEFGLLPTERLLRLSLYYDF